MWREYKITKSTTVRALTIVVAVVGLALLPLSGDNYIVYLASLAMCYSFGAISLNLLMGYGASLSLGHAGFFAIGAYTLAILIEQFDVPVLVAVAVAVGLGSVIGVVVAFPTLRLSGLYLAIGTLAFGLIIERLIHSGGEMTGGPNGLGVYPPLSSGEIYWILLAVFLLSLLIYRNSLSGGFRLVLMATRDHEIAAQSLGVHLPATKVKSFVASAGLTSLGGAFYAMVVGYIVGSSFTLDLSLLFIVMVVLGGSGTIYGPIVGALFVVALPELTKGTGFSDHLIYGLAIIAIVLFLPGGLASIVRTVRARFSREGAGASRVESRGERLTGTSSSELLGNEASSRRP